MSTSMCWAGPGGVQTVAPPSDAASPVHLAAQPVSIVTTESPIIAPFNSFWNSNPFSEQAREGEGGGVSAARTTQLLQPADKMVCSYQRHNVAVMHTVRVCLRRTECY